MFFNQLDTIRTAADENESKAYRLTTLRRPLTDTIRKDIKALTGETGLSIFTDAFLAVEGARYLIVDLSGKIGTTYGERLNIQQIELRRNSFGGLSAYDVDRNICHGEIAPWSFRSLHEHPEWAFRPDHPDYRPTWWTPAYFAANVLPLSGPILAHPFAARQARYAASLLDANNTTISQIAVIDEAQDRLAAERAKLSIKAQALPSHVYGDDLIALLQSESQDLVKMIGQMDFYHRYADSIIHSSVEREDAIRRGLDQLPLNDAAALFVTSRPDHWMEAANYLRHHPALKLAKAA